MDNCVAAMAIAVAAHRRLKQRVKKIDQLALVLGLLDEENAIVSREHICSLCVVQELRPRYRLDNVGGHMHSTVCMARCGLPAASVWLCMPQMVEDHVLYDVAVVSA